MPDNNGVQYTNPPQSRNEAIVEAIIDGTEYTDPPQSENEEILVSILNDTPYEKPPRSRFADLLLKLKEFIGGGGGGRPKVPQTGTWQYKTTPTKGHLTVGHDDDTGDEAMIVRMVSGYGFPITINCEAVKLDTMLNSDADSTYSLYPSGSTANFPDGVTVKDLCTFINENNLGEVAQHDESSYTLWDSTNIDTYMDSFFSTYEAGGGTKTKAELKQAILDKYASTDVAQGASRVTEQRAILEEAIKHYVLTIGMWGGTPNIVIDEIIVGTFQNLKTGYNSLARQNNYFADSILAGYAINKGSMPYRIVRESTFSAANAETLCEALYEEKGCAEIFAHQILSGAGTQEQWENFKAVLDKIKTYVDAGKIEVVTRLQMAQLGEYVNNPIKAISLTTDALMYEKGTTISANNFICKAILNDDTEIICEEDKILDFSGVDSSTVGTYTAYLQYRGFKATGSVQIVDSQPTNYLLENGSFSGANLERGDICDLSPSINYEANKTYKCEFDFTAETSVTGTAHYFTFRIGEYKTAWVDSIETATINSQNGTTSGHAIITFTTITAKTVSKAINLQIMQNTTASTWSVTNAYIYEVPSE